MRFYLLLILFFLSISSVANADAIINEVMYAPNNNWGGENNEWIEILNNGSTDMSIANWTIDGKTIPDALIPSQGYLILAKNSTKFLEVYGQMSVRVPFTLSNTGKALNLTASDGSTADIFDYTKYATANLAKNNNRSLERTLSGWFESIAAGGTPGAQNNISIPSNSTSIDDENTQNMQQSPRIEIVRSPSSMKFGDLKTIQARFLSGSRSFSKMRFVAYVYSPVWIANDLTREENTLRNAPYNAIVAAELEGIEADTTHNLLLPLILKCNPDGKYADGSYTVRVRGYSLNDGSWSDIAEKDTQISVRGENELCDKEMCKSESVGGNKTEKEGCSLEERESGSFDANITVPDAAFIGRNFTTKILLKNRINSSLDLELYTYLYEHSTIMSQGWSGEKWGNARASNSRKVSLEPHGSAVIELVSMPRGNISAEKYTFKVEIDDLNDRKNSREFVYLVKVEEAPADEKTGSIINESGKGEENKITGNIIGENSESSFWEKIIEKIKHWLKM